MYSVFTKNSDGEFILIAFCDDLEEAVKLVKTLGAEWPREYVVRDSKGKDVELD